MAAVQPEQAAPGERRFSPGLTINPGVNNPFRRGSNSPALSPPPRPNSAHQRPLSRNPFLDQSNMPEAVSGTTNGTSQAAAQADDLFKNLSLSDTSRRPRNENLPPHMHTAHRPTRSQEDERRRQVKTRDGPDTLDIFADPQPHGSPRRRHEGRPRRNSDSSVADPEEERRRRERRHREYRQRDSKGRPIPPTGPRPRKPNKRIDVIDKLDVTSIFGSGVFHHDGPFDACNPHRNRKGSSRAPMQAFPKDSMNNVIGGSGPLRSGINLADVHGHQADSYTDFNNDATAPRPSTAVREVQSPGEAIPMYPHARDPGPPRPRAEAHDAPDRASTFNAGAKINPLHGEESLGLGTSTFLEGAPAARAAITRRESESESAGGGAGGLGRKKSLAQKIRGMGGDRAGGRSGSLHRGGAGQPLASPEARYYDAPTSPDAVQSAGGLPKIAERNPFFADYQGGGKGGGGTRVTETAAVQSPGEGTFESEQAEAALTSPRAGMTRRATEGASGADSGDGEAGRGGFLSRVKSLKGGGRAKARAERRE